MTDAPETYTAKDEVGQVRARRTRWERTWIELKKAPLTAWFGMIVIACYVFVAVFAGWLAPYAEADSSFGAYLPWGDGQPQHAAAQGRLATRWALPLRRPVLRSLSGAALP